MLSMRFHDKKHRDFYELEIQEGGYIYLISKSGRAIALKEDAVFKILEKFFKENL